MNLSEKQQAFSICLARLITHLVSEGYGVTLGEAYRPQEMADIYAKEGKGIRNSLHTMRLAVDLNLFKAGEFLTEKDAYGPAGEFWESLSTDDFECCWGGRFNDSDHFSISHGGIK